MKAFVARNHNGTLIDCHVDLGNVMEAANLYKEVTGNRCTISEEEFEKEPLRNKFSMAV